MEAGQLAGDASTQLQELHLSLKMMAFHRVLLVSEIGCPTRLYSKSAPFSTSLTQTDGQSGN